MEGYTINLVDCTRVLCEEVAQGSTQKQVALSYAMAIKSKMQGADDPDWRLINTCILGRWKMSGLKHIKKRALDIVAGKIDPSA